MDYVVHFTPGSHLGAKDNICSICTSARLSTCILSSTMMNIWMQMFFYYINGEVNRTTFATTSLTPSQPKMAQNFSSTKTNHPGLKSLATTRKKMEPGNSLRGNMTITSQRTGCQRLLLHAKEAC